MNFTDYQEKAYKTLNLLQDPLLDNLHMIAGISTEAGELLDAFKKHFAYGKELDWVNIREELGDIMWYIANFCKLNSIDFDSVLEKNIQKLEVRYGQSFNKDAAVNRDLDKEREVLS